MLGLKPSFRLILASISLAALLSTNPSTGALGHEIRSAPRHHRPHQQRSNLSPPDVLEDAVIVDYETSDYVGPGELAPPLDERLLGLFDSEPESTSEPPQLYSEPVTKTYTYTRVLTGVDDEGNDYVTTRTRTRTRTYYDVATSSQPSTTSTHSHTRSHTRTSSTPTVEPESSSTAGQARPTSAPDSDDDYDSTSAPDTITDEAATTTTTSRGGGWLHDILGLGDSSSSSSSSTDYDNAGAETEDSTTSTRRRPRPTSTSGSGDNTGTTDSSSNNDDSHNSSNDDNSDNNDGSSSSDYNDDGEENTTSTKPSSKPSAKPSSSSSSSSDDNDGFFGFNPDSSSSSAHPTRTRHTGWLDGIFGNGDETSTSTSASSRPARPTDDYGNGDGDDESNSDSVWSPTKTRTWDVQPTDTWVDDPWTDGEDNTSSTTKTRTRSAKPTGPWGDDDGESTSSISSSSTSNSWTQTPSWTYTHVRPTSSSSSYSWDDSMIPSSLSHTNTSTAEPTGVPGGDGSSTTDASQSSSDSWTESESSSSTRSPSKTTSSDPYWYANRSTLKLAPTSSATSDYSSKENDTSAKPTSSSSSSGGSNDDSSSGDDKNNGNSGQTQNQPTYPSTIVPSDAAFTQPSGTTSIALLFKDTMPWSWVVNQADLTAQIFGFMPGLISGSITEEEEETAEVTTVRLQQYNLAGTWGAQKARTMYVAYIPTSQVEELQSMIKNTSSPFYQGSTDGAALQLAQEVDSSFDILTAAGVVKDLNASESQQSGSKDEQQSTLRNGLIGVGTSIGGCAALVIGYMYWKRQQRRKVRSSTGSDMVGRSGGLGVTRPRTIQSFGGGLRETWAPVHLDSSGGGVGGGDGREGMVEVWEHEAQPYSYGAADGFGGLVTSPVSSGSGSGSGPFADPNMMVSNRSSRITERSVHSDMTEAQRIQYEYEASQRSLSPQGQAQAQALTTAYQDDYVVPEQQTSQHAYGYGYGRRPPTNRRRGSVASSIISRPEMTSNSMLL